MISYMTGHRVHAGTHEHGAHGPHRLDDPARDAWQRPDDVMRALALAPSMTVADVGAGTGYFAVRLARALPAGAVIAIDTDPDMLRHLEERAHREHLPNLRAMRATPTSCGLAARSVDAILVVHVWHHIAERSSYARELAAALRPGGRLIVVDYAPAGETGPPAHMRLSADAVIAELTDAGLTARRSAIALPDQYIVEAWTP